MLGKPDVSPALAHVLFLLCVYIFIMYIYIHNIIIYFYLISLFAYFVVRYQEKENLKMHRFNLLISSQQKVQLY